MNRVKIEFEGVLHDPFEPGAEWASDWLFWSEEEHAFYGRVISEGTFLVPPRREPMKENIAKRVRARLLNKYIDTPRPGALIEDEGRWLVPEVWRWGHRPILSGQPRAGKSTFVADLVASLVIPGRRFLNFYEPSEISDAERSRGVWLINAENPQPEQRDILAATGLEWRADEFDVGRYYPPDGAPGWLMVDHLSAFGDPSAFDLRDPALYDLWVNRITDVSCDKCDGLDEAPPLAIIVDGLTAILGSKTENYGAWSASWRRFMNELDVPNGLVVAHSPKDGGEAMNGVESIAGADGSWMLEMSSFRNHRSARTFRGSRRLVTGGIDGGRIVIGEGGRLSLVPGDKAARPKSKDGGPDREEPILERLRAAGDAGMLTTEVTGDGEEGRANRRALTRLEELGLVVSTPERNGRARGIRWRLAPPPVAD